MKKLFIFGMAAALLAGCSSDDNFADEARQAGFSDSDLAQIELLLGNAGTRGTGTVGSVAADAAGNKWAGQKFNVLMMNKDVLTIAEDAAHNKIYQNAEFYAPNEMLGISSSSPALEATAATAGSLEVSSKVSYFPQEGSYDFWAYRLDGAEDEAIDDTNPKVVGDSMVIKFTIDGSQDIMFAKAVPGDAAAAAAIDERRIFSAYSARRDVKPMLNFKHQLARIQFQVLVDNNDEALCNKSVAPATSVADTTLSNNCAIKITSIKLKSMYMGEMNVAWKSTYTPTDTINWKKGTPADSTNLVLKQRQMTYTPATIGSWVALTGLTADNYGTVIQGTNITLEASTIVYASNTPALDAKGLPTGGFYACEAGTGTNPDLGDCFVPVITANPSVANPITDIAYNENLETLSPVAPIWDTTNDKPFATPVGEALLVPSQTYYDLTVGMTQLLPSKTKTIYYAAKLTLANTGGNGAYDGDYYFMSDADKNAAKTAFDAWDADNSNATKQAALVTALAKGKTTSTTETVVTEYKNKNSVKTFRMYGPKKTVGSETSYKPFKANNSYTIKLTLSGSQAITGTDDNITIGGYTEVTGEEGVDIDMDEEQSLP